MAKTIVKQPINVTYTFADGRVFTYEELINQKEITLSGDAATNCIKEFYGINVPVNKKSRYERLKQLQLLKDLAIYKLIKIFEEEKLIWVLYYSPLTINNAGQALKVGNRSIVGSGWEDFIFCSYSFSINPF